MYKNTEIPIVIIKIVHKNAGKTFWFLPMKRNSQNPTKPLFKTIASLQTICS